MAIYSSLSRYEVDDSGVLAFRGAIERPNYTLYRCKSGDTLEIIAARLLGSTERYWEIADINPQIKFPLDLSAGTVIRIPT